MAGGGTTSGLSALMLLGVVWVALYDGRKALVITIASMAVALALPIALAGSPDYPPLEWRRAAVLTGLGLIIGTSILGLVRRVRLRGDDAARGREFLLAVMNSAAEGIVSIDGKGRVQYANPAGCALLGYTPDEIRGENFHALVHHTRADGSPFPDQECPINATLVDGIEQEVDDDIFWRARRKLVPRLLQERRHRQPLAIDGVVVTFTDISERRRIEEMKDELVSVVSHELRTPLTSIRGSLGLIAGGAVGRDPRRGRADDRDRRHQHRPAGAHDQRDPRHGADRVGTGRALAAALRLRGADAARRGDDGRPGGGGGNPDRGRASWVLLWADPDRITQTLINLLSNAVKFSPPGVPVILRAVRDDGEVRFEVIDRGRGIPAEQLEGVFERFRQVDASDSREKGGHGARAADRRSIVHQHGGRMWAESEPGEGTTMTLHPAGRGLQPGDLGGGRGHDGPLALVIEDDPDLDQDPEGAPRRRGDKSGARPARPRRCGCSAPAGPT